jgi:hypothetical protein
MPLGKQLERIKSKLEQLKHLGKELKLFGASSHEYTLNPTLTLEQIKVFEVIHKVDLPEEYVAFLTQLGDAVQAPSTVCKPSRRASFATMQS